MEQNISHMHLDQSLSRTNQQHLLFSKDNGALAVADGVPVTFWDQIKSNLRAAIPLEDYQKWIVPLSAQQVAERHWVISVPNMIFYQMIIDRFLAHIEAAKSSLGLESLSIHFEVNPLVTGSNQQVNRANQESNYGEPLESPATESLSTLPNDVTARPHHQVQASQLIHPTQTNQSSTGSILNPRYTFATFVSGPSNQFAHASCSTVAEKPGKAYNPLFIYGSTGLGKTHLLHAVGNRIKQNNPGAILTYITSEHFLNEMIYCVRFGKMWEFRQKYRQCDVFLVDDIQFISGNKEKTQEEFFHTFNALYEAKKQIVITSDMFPQDIPDIEDRLRNRFQWGLIADIQPPDTEHRVAILLSKAEKLGIKLGEDVAMYIASHAKRNVRELEGALHRICAFSDLQGRPINMELAAETFQNILSEAPKLLTIETIQKIVADHYKIKVSELKSHKRQRNLTMPRQIAMFLSRMLTNASFPELGERFGGKDHTTVMHAVRKIEKDRTKDLDLKAHIDSIQRQLEQMS